jgi:hypothetical protein
MTAGHLVFGAHFLLILIMDHATESGPTRFGFPRLISAGPIRVAT